MKVSTREAANASKHHAIRFTLYSVWCWNAWSVSLILEHDFIRVEKDNSLFLGVTWSQVPKVAVRGHFFATKAIIESTQCSCVSKELQFLT